MKKLTVFLLSFLLACTSLLAQNATIKGVVTDTLNKENLFNASVSVLRAKDSVLMKYTRSDKDGKFQLKNLKTDKYIMMITYPSFADYYETIDLAAKPEADLGTVKLTLKSKLLEDVVVRSRIAAIRLKGDTIEYKADSFKVSPGASVEEMLRKLPGLQVDKDGNITAQGEKIEKVLVDGEEFFGDDPTMATKNLQADAVDKVQVYNKKSDQSTFTGIDDGQKTKTLNLTLKEDRKHGYFGKVELKAGPANRWNNTLMGNAFKGKRKLSAYGIMSSTGTTGLNWNERRSYGDGGGLEYNADEGYFTSSGGNDEFDNPTYNGMGIPKSWSTGVNYGNKYNRDQQTVNGSYRYNRILTEGSGKTFTQSILPTNVLYNNETQYQYSNKQRHSANGTYEWMIDSFTSIKVVARGYKGDAINNSIYSSEVRDSINNLVNTSRRNSFGESNNESFNSNFIVRRRFKKAGRTISLSFDEQYRKNSSDGVIFSIADFYEKTGLKRRSDTTDQQKINDNTLTAYNTKLAYTEPIVKNTFLEVSYALRLTQSESERLSYNKSLAGKYEMLDPLFSNQYHYKVLTNTGGLMLRYNTKKYNISGGGDIGKSDFTQRDLLKDTAKHYSYTNLFPRATFQYKFNTTTSFSLNYNGSTRQPTIEQLQPVRDNSNVLNVAIGNPNLKQEFRHNFNMSYNFYKVLAQSGLYTSASFSTVSNAITTNETVDTTGFRTYQFINVNGNYNGSFWGGYNFKLKKLDMNMNFGVNLNTNHYNNVINKQKNASDNTSYGVSAGLYKYKEKKYNISYYSSFNYNTSVSSVKNNFKTNYLTQNHNLYLNLTLPKRFELNTSVNANFRQKLSASDQNNNVVQWNGYFGRKLFKNDKGMIRFEANDILNQNKGFSRYVNANVLRENTYETLGRYFMLAFVWNFSKTPAGMAPPQ